MQSSPSGRLSDGPRTPRPRPAASVGTAAVASSTMASTSSLSAMTTARSSSGCTSPTGPVVRVSGVTVTATSPVDTPDCFLGYVVPDGQGRLRAVAGGFQRSSNFTVLEEVSAEAGALTVGGGSAEVDVTFPELGRLQARFTAGSPGPGWANSACPKAVLAYALAASAATTVYSVAAVDGTLSRNLSSEEVSLYEAPRPVTCFAYFTGP